MTGPRWIWGYVVVLACSIGVGYLAALLPFPIELRSFTLSALFVIVVFNMLPIVVFSLAGVRRLPAIQNTQPAGNRVRFLVIVAAYNESRVIHNSVSSILSQEASHSEARLVVAFNGTDETGRVASELGAEVITTPQPRCGKTQAIAFALSQIEQDSDRYVAILDADNVAEPDFLDQMAKLALSGSLAIQGNHQALLAHENWISRGLAAGYAASSRLFNPGRARLLDSALLCGTGFAMKEDVFRSLWPEIRTQTEDIELNALLTLRFQCGVQWAQNARFFDEKPDSIRVAIRQRVRWMVGHMRCFGFYTVPLLRHAWRYRDLRALELASYYAVPWTILLAALWLTFVFPASFIGGLDVAGMPYQLGLGASLAIGVHIVGMPFFGQMLSQSGEPHTVRTVVAALRDALFSACFALLAWPLAIMLASLLLAREDWIFHTPHRALKVRP